MTISQSQIVDYLNKKLGYGVSKTDVSTAKSPSNESNASPLLTTGGTIWQLSNLIGAGIPTGNTSVVTVYNDNLSSTVQCTKDITVSTPNSTWHTNLTDWIPPLFGSSYQIKVYAAPAGTLTPQASGTLLPPDGSGNNDSWFFDYQSGILNFADTNIPSAVSGNVIYIVGARYTGQKGISNFPNGLTMSNVTVSGNTVIGGNIILTGSAIYANGQSIGGTTYSNSNVASYLTGTVNIGNVITTNGVFWANGRVFAPITYTNANVSSYLPTDSTIIGINSNLGSLTSNAGLQAVALNTINANLGTATNNITILYANAVTQQTQIISLATGANANTAAYLLNSDTINIINATESSGVGTGAFRVAGGASVGANLYVGGNLIVFGNTYELQTEIITQSEIVGENIYAKGYFWANGEPLNYGNVQVAAFLPTYTGSLANSTDIITLYANAGLQSNRITGANARIQTIDANLGTATTNITTLFANAASQAVTLNTITANLGTATTNITTLFANAAGQAVTLNTITANLGTATTNITTLFANAVAQAVALTTLDANLGTASTNIDLLLANAASQGQTLLVINSNLGTTAANVNTLFANAATQAVALNTINANLGTATTDITTLYANAATQSSQISTLTANVATNVALINSNITNLWANAVTQNNQIVSLAAGANANTAAYLLNSNIINITNSTEATTFGTGAFKVTGGASIGANLYVGGNLIVFGNTYELQTEIISQNEIVTNNIYAGGYFYANGQPFQSSSFGNGNVAAYLPTYYGNIGANYITVNGTVYAANIITAGASGNITNANNIFANNYCFSSNGVNIINAIVGLVGTYSNSNVASYLSTSNVSIANVITTNGVFWANGVNALTPAYGNTQVAAYLPTHTGNVGAANINLSGNITSTGNVLRFTSGDRGTGVISGALTPIVNNPYVFSGSYALSTTTPTALNTAGNVSLQLGGTSFCVQFWLNLSSAPTSNPIIFGKDQNIAGAPIEYYGTITPTSIYFSTTSGVNTASNYSFTPQTNTWYHIAWTCDGTYYRTFVNGQMGTPTLVAGNTITNAAGPLYVGASARGTNFLTGQIQDFRIDRGAAIYTAPFTPPSNYLNSGSNTVYYLKNWTQGASISSTTDFAGGTGFYNVRMVNSLSPATTTTVGPFTSGTNGQAILFDGSSTWYSTSGFQVQSNANSVSTTSGALTVIGGAGVIGNLYAGQFVTSGNVTSGYLLSDNLRYANGVPYVFGSTYSNANVTALLSAYSNSISSTSNITTTANVSGLYILGNGSQLTGLPSQYGNANVAAYLLTDPSFTSLQANLGAYQIFSNANASTQATSINSINANLGAYQIYANANATTQATSINSINANLGAYQIYANANIGTITTSLQTLNANVGAYEVWANATLASKTSLQVLSANVGAYEKWANIQISGLSGEVTTLFGMIYTDADVVALLTTYTGDLSAGNIFTDSLQYANGVPYNLGTTYSNSNVASYLPVYSGNVAATNVISGNIYSGIANLTLVPGASGITTISSTTALKLPSGGTASRPIGVGGYIRFNSDNSSVEYYDGSQWVSAINSILDQAITGDGTTKTFTLNQLATTIGVLVSINGTVQTPGVAYSVSGNQITFAEAPLSTDFVDVRFLIGAPANSTDIMVINSGNVAVSTSLVVIDSWSSSTYRSAKYTISSSTGTESQMADVYVTHNGSSAFISNVTLKTGANSVNFTTSLVSGNVRLQATGTTTNNQLRIQRTYFNI